MKKMMLFRGHTSWANMTFPGGKLTAQRVNKAEYCENIRLFFQHSENLTTVVNLRCSFSA
jgi:hypothetical protein